LVAAGDEREARCRTDRGVRVRLQEAHAVCSQTIDIRCAEIGTSVARHVGIAEIVGALQGKTKEELLLTRFSPIHGLWTAYPLAPAVARVANGSFLQEEPPVIRGDGYVTRCLEAALWAFAKSTRFADGALLAVNLGEDADTTGAVYGQLAGAYYGADSIPERWRSKLAKLDVLESFARRLHEAAESFA
jgi:ADP-ribosylglycohydrolase